MKAMSFAMLASLCLSTSAGAGAMDLKKYREMEQGEPYRTYNRIYLNGLIDGLGAANDALGLRHQALLYCQPKNLLLPVEQVKDIMFKEAAKTTLSDDAECRRYYY